MNYRLPRLSASGETKSLLERPTGNLIRGIGDIVRKSRITTEGKQQQIKSSLS